jgi:excisionase family DNA binding protein
MTDAPDFLRAVDITRLTGLSLRTVRRWIADKFVPSVKIRGARLVPRKPLERVLSPGWLENLDVDDEKPK